ncbi:hypothetical protein [Furfurilactobacillus entadae]|uniref:hypothetical protein n=1 Tax=Furfurilactobacillus entadae TaxID=2922307 RepID=UPI0035EB9536
MQQVINKPIQVSNKAMLPLIKIGDTLYLVDMWSNPLWAFIPDLTWYFKHNLYRLDSGEEELIQQDEMLALTGNRWLQLALGSGLIIWLFLNVTIFPKSPSIRFVGALVMCGITVALCNRMTKMRINRFFGRNEWHGEKKTL